MASSRKYSPLIPLESLSVGSTRLRSTRPDQARIPTGIDARPFEFRIRERQKISSNCPYDVHFTIKNIAINIPGHTIVIPQTMES